MRFRLLFQVSIGILLVGFMLFAVFYEVTPHHSETQKDKFIKDFELTDYNKQVFRFNDLKPYYKFVYFGFTFCPDICPASLNKISNVLNTLDKYGYKDFRALFISVDPKRDTPEYLKNYVTHFHQNIIAITGDDVKLQEITQDFGAYYAVVPNEAKPENYLVNHTSFIYLIGKNNEYITHFHLESSVEEIVDFIVQHKLR